MITIKFRDDVTFQDLSRATGKHSEHTTVDTQKMTILAPSFDTTSNNITTDTVTIDLKASVSSVDSSIIDVSAENITIEASMVQIPGILSISQNNITIDSSANVVITAPNITLSGITSIDGDIMI